MSLVQLTARKKRMSKVEQIRKDLAEIGTGYGLMGLTWRDDPVPKEQAFECMLKVIEFSRANNHKAFFNVGEFYGPKFINLTYVKEFFEKYPETRKEVIISCKGAMNVQEYKALLKSDEIRKSVETCTKHLGTFIDIFEPARLDPTACKEGEAVPAETFDTLAALVDEGVIGAFSLSEANAKEITAVHKGWGKYLVCVELELSMFSYEILTDGIAKACNNANVAIICYSPLGKGFLTGAIRKNDDLDDFRKHLKYFNGDDLNKNLSLVKFLEDEILAKRDSSHTVTLAQIALGWVVYWNKQKEYSNTKFIPIPGGTTIDKLVQNFDEKKCTITDDEFAKIEKFLGGFTRSGNRYEFITNPFQT